MPPSMGHDSEFDEPMRPPEAYAQRGSIWNSLTPKWVKDWRDIKRGKELPFPATSAAKRMDTPRSPLDAPATPSPYREPTMVRRMDFPRTPIDAPVSPTSFRSEFEETTTSDPFRFDNGH